MSKDVFEKYLDPKQRQVREGLIGSLASLPFKVATPKTFLKTKDWHTDRQLRGLYKKRDVLRAKLGLAKLDQQKRQDKLRAQTNAPKPPEKKPVAPAVSSAAPRQESATRPGTTTPMAMPANAPPKPVPGSAGAKPALIKPPAMPKLKTPKPIKPLPPPAHAYNSAKPHQGPMKMSNPAAAPKPRQSKVENMKIELINVRLESVRTMLKSLSEEANSVQDTAKLSMAKKKLANLRSKLTAGRTDATRVKAYGSKKRGV